MSTSSVREPEDHRLEVDLWMHEEDDRIFFCAVEGEEFACVLVVHPYDDAAVLHCEVYRWNLRYLALYREMFGDIRAVLREKGIRQLVPATGENGEKMQRFAQLFGFRCLDVFEQGSDTVHFAVMEA